MVTRLTVHTMYMDTMNDDDDMQCSWMDVFLSLLSLLSLLIYALAKTCNTVYDEKDIGGNIFTDLGSPVQVKRFRASEVEGKEN